MTNYDFHALLEPLEFQELFCDIIQCRENIKLETYKEGRDWGIDGFYTDEYQTIIVQAKRYKPDSFARLYHDLKNVELPKVKKLKPDRYILGVSMDFDPVQKEKVLKLFEGYINTTDDILSQKDLNNHLKDPKYKSIELNYPKLWFASINVFLNTLNKTVHKAIYKESEEELKKAIREASHFVPTRIYRQALHNWESNNVILLTGEPGVGKTTMAHILALSYLQPNHLEGFVWANSIDDVYAMLENEEKQVIILDDFWGSIFHEEHRRGNQEKRLDSLMKSIIATDGNKRLILTTREYVLQQGLQKQPALKETLEKFVLICTIEEYGYDEKARIFYKHLFSSKLNYEYVYYLYLRSDRIIYHQNYNPRVLALFLDKDIDRNCSPEEYYYELDSYFDDPGEFWKSVFIELSPESQVVAILLLISSTPMRLADMELCYRNYIQDSVNPTKIKSIGDCIAELEKTMIKTFHDEYEDDILLKFSMPAVQDFLYAYIKENSEQWIPLILRSCSFYNQFQFLLEHLSRDCSETIRELIVQKCILHYEDYNSSYFELDGSWKWDIDTDYKGDLHRYYQLLRCCEKEWHPTLYRFLEEQINNYCLTMESTDVEEQYTDLHNLPNIIVQCIKKGMNFNGEEIIKKYHKKAFSVFHFRAMNQFTEVFPNDYADFHATYHSQIKKKLKKIILSELDLLEEFYMEDELEVLIHSIPELLKEFGLRYTKKFEEEIFSLCGRIPIVLDSEQQEFQPTSRDYMDQEEIDLHVVKEDARNWLLGPSETDLEEEQIYELVAESSLSVKVKNELKKVLEVGQPYFVFDYLQTQESVELLLTTLQDLQAPLPKQENHLYMMMLWQIAEGNQELLYKLMGFCAESFAFLVYKEEPIIRLQEFLSSEIYSYHLKNDEEFRDIVLKKLIIRDEQWACFCHIPLFIFCHMFVQCAERTESELEKICMDLCGDSFVKYKHTRKRYLETETNMLYYDFGMYYFRRFDWEGCAFRLLEELVPFEFNRVYVEPKLKSYIDKIGSGDENSKILNHISLCQYQFTYDRFGNSDMWMSVVGDEISVIEHLSIAKGFEIYPRDIAKDILLEFMEDEKVCESNDGKWRVLVYKINDVEHVKELGIYGPILDFIKDVEKVYTKFLSGDYSSINGLEVKI